MLQLPLEQEIILKYQTLSRPLRDTLESRYDLKRIREVAKRHSLIEEDVEVVMQLVGLSMLGFLNPRGLAEELFNFLELRNRKTIDALAEELTREILAPLKNELQNLYRTPNVFSEPAKKTAPQPEAPVPEAKEMPVPAVETQPVAQPVPIRREGVGAPGPVSLETLRMAPEPALVPQAGPVPPAKAAEPVMPLRPAESTQAKIHPFALGQTPIRSAVPSSAKAPEGEPAPFMLHKEETFTPILESKQVQIQREGTARALASKPTAVRLEISGAEEKEKKKEPVVAKTEMREQRVVHYSTFRTPINPFGGETAAAPSAPTAPITPAPTLLAPQAAPTAPAKNPVIPQPAAKEEVIDLSTFQRAPAPQKPPAAQPKLEGNTVDLRQK